MNNNNYVAIMAGGIGSRFWPMSRTAYPKQFLDILNCGNTLLQSTYNRFLNFIPEENIYIITATEYVPIVQQQLPQMPTANIIGEPTKKNTAPCVALISLKLFQLNPEANLIVAPSDHLIPDESIFEKTCQVALNFTQHNNAFVTLGIKPTYANTGYGYIQFECKTTDKNIYPVKRFTEKPNLKKATEFVNNGSYLWNAGIFIWKAKDIIDAFRNFMPEMFNTFISNLSNINTPAEEEALSRIYSDCEAVSIDYAIMEKAKNVFVIPCDFSWSDLGTWNSAWENSEKDAAKNAVAGESVFLADTKNSLIHSTDKKLLMIGGVEDLIIVNTPDALLICKRENEQQIKEYLENIKQSKGELYL